MGKIKNYFCLLCILSLAISGCGTSDSMDIPEVNGTYTGTLNLSGSSANFEAVLEETDKNVSGNGTIKASSSTIALSFTGTHSHPDISITGSSEGLKDFNLKGTVSDEGDKIDATINGSGLNDVDITLLKK